MKRFLLLVACILFSHSLAFAMEVSENDNDRLDKKFSGKILVIGGETKNHPQRVSLNITGSNVDIEGSGWDINLVKRLTPGKYEIILFEHIGGDLGRIFPSDYKPSCGPGPLMQAYYALLQPGGRLDFLSHGTFFTQYYDKTVKEQASFLKCFNLRLKYSNEDKCLMVEKKQTGELLSKEVFSITFPTIMNVSESFNPLVSPLVRAGFVDITVQHEQDEPNHELGTRSHNSLHISARKPLGSMNKI